ncbi:PREDICTED: olfactory receptor 7C1-like [Elephantulus edwardii]|uniref:olfactory receptor 7C1-like n=1 Tax=Elephantulus edwardii TaxID=28737 RepID=UPI0003F0C27F|nr:PREDICTED: olfactory receptor 7C1-like [Elephantulus edwardii]
MEPENQTHVLEFILLGLPGKADLQPLLFGLFLSMYLVTFTGNLLIILAIITDSRLHTPMYLFLSNLSFADICFTSTTVPKMLLNIQMQNKVITYEGCLSQMYFFITFGDLDNVLLTVMAYDRFVAICHPLHYTVIMSPKVCGLLLLVAWMLSVLDSLLHCFMVVRLKYMEPENQTHVLEFILLGLSDEADLQPLLFGLFLSMYLVTFTGNLLIILATITDSHLHTPMYFFLSNLSLTDICFTSTTVPKMLLNIQMQNKVITYEGCLSQMYFFMIFGYLDISLLTVMAYDRFVAICHPLNYTVIMSPKVCGLLLLVSWILSVLDSLLQCLMVLRLSFCTEMEIPHFFCDINQVIQLACSDTFLNDLMVFFESGLFGVIPLTAILFSYFKIVSSILRMSSAGGKYKAFSTCGSHLSVVSLFYGTGLGVYLSPTASQNSKASAIASVVFTVVTPMLNPFIYSLRNRDIKQALKKLFS